MRRDNGWHILLRKLLLNIRRLRERMVVVKMSRLRVRGLLFRRGKSLMLQQRHLNHNIEIWSDMSLDMSLSTSLSMKFKTSQSMSRGLHLHNRKRKHILSRPAAAQYSLNNHNTENGQILRCVTH
jgi:hypothetical protein